MTQPDIHYFPDFKKYQARTKRRLETENIDYSFPPGFPKKLESSLVWEGTDFEAPTGASVDWVYTLSDGELKEVDLALRYFNSLEKEYGYISPDTFPLQTLHSRLRGFSDEIHAGRGFIVLRGLPVHKYSRAENLIIFVGISSHIGSQRDRQDHSFEGEPADVVLSHIIDLQNTAHRSSIGAPAYTNDLQAFHTDSGDIIGLYMLSESAIGGESQIASSWRVYNELANLRPDLLRTLAEDWVIDRKKSATPYINRPLIYHQPQNSRTPERVVLQCSRGSFTTFGALKRSPNIPPITEAQAEALDALHFLAEKFHLSFAMRKGDIQYVNDYSVLHARSTYVDDSENNRHLLRLWFRDPENAWQTPEQLITRWNGVYSGVRPETQVFPLEPYVRNSMNVDKIK